MSSYFCEKKERVELMRCDGMTEKKREKYENAVNVNAICYQDRCNHNSSHKTQTQNANTLQTIMHVYK